MVEILILVVWLALSALAFFAVYYGIAINFNYEMPIVQIVIWSLLWPVVLLMMLTQGTCSPREQTKNYKINTSSEKP